MLCNNDYSGANTLKEKLLQNLRKYFSGNDKHDHFTSIEEKEICTIAILIHFLNSRGFFNKEAGDQAELLLTQLIAIQI